MGPSRGLYFGTTCLWYFFGNRSNVFKETHLRLHLNGVGDYCYSVLSFTVWLHHFFTMGAGAAVNTFFGIMTMIISVPTGVKVFNWIFTMYRGRVEFKTPM